MADATQVDTATQTAATSTGASTQTAAADTTQQASTSTQSTQTASTTGATTGAGGQTSSTTAAATTTTADDSAKSYWPEDWREKFAGEDAAALKRLQRYASLPAALEALFNAQKKISSGELRSSLKADATPEERAEWREQNGIPATAADYKIELPSGLVVGERDKPVVDAFLKQAHDANMPPDQVNKALGFYFEQQEIVAQEQAAFDIGSQQACEDLLREEYGPEYRKNLVAVTELLNSAPGEITQKLLNGRLEDGTPIGNSPEVIRWLVGLARERNPIGTLVPGSGSNAMQAAENELGNLRKMMGDKTSEYWKGPNAAKNQERYRALVSATQKVGAR